LLNYSTNGVGIYQVDMQTRKQVHTNRYLAPDEVWAMTFGALRSR